MQQTVYRIALFLAKLGVFVIALLSLIGVLAVAMTQYEPFRQWAIDKGLEFANDALAGKLSVGDVEGNLITGITIHDVRLDAGDTALAVIPQIDLRYSLSPIFESRRIVASIVLHNPEIGLLRNTEGTWNFSQIARPSTDTTQGPRSPLAWVFDVRGLEIRDGTLALYDSTSAPTSSSGHIDFMHTQLRQLNLGLSAFISENEQTVDIDNLSFVLDEQDLRVVELAGGISVDEDGLRVKELRIETDRSYVRMDVAMDSVRLFDSALGTSWMRYPFSLALDGRKIDTDELQKMLPQLDFLGGTPSVSLNASGTFGRIVVDDLSLDLDRTFVNGQAVLTNLDDPDNLLIEAELSDTRLNYADVPVYLPGIPIPDLAYLGDVDVEKLTYSGTRDDFTSVFDLTSAIGKVQGGSWLRYGRNVPDWRLDLAVSDFNPGPVMGDSLYAGNLNARILADGEGFVLDEMAARLRVKSVSSSVGGRKLERLWFQGAIANGGVITADTLLAAWGAAGSSPALQTVKLDELSALLERGRRGPLDGFMQRVRLGEADAAFFDGLPSVRASGWYDMRDLARPKYSLLVETDRLDVSELTLDPEHQTRVGLTLSVEGEGLDPDDMQGAVELNVTDAVLPSGDEVKPFSANISLGQGEEERTLLFESTFLYAKLEGQWRFATLLPTLTEAIDRLVNYVSRKRSYSAVDEFDLMSFDAPEVEPIRVEYELEPKDLSIVEAFMEGTELEMDASLRGVLSGTTDLLGITSTGKINSFRYSTEGQNLRLGSAQIDVNIRNISTASMDDLLDADVLVRSDSLIRYNDIELALPKLKLDFLDGMLHANGAATLNGEYSFAVDGRLDVTAPEGYQVVVDTLLFKMSDQLQWNNVDPIDVMLADDGILIDKFILSRPGAEYISVSGDFVDYERFRNIEVEVLGLPLQQLKPFLVDPEILAMVETLSGTMREVKVQLNGTLDDPEIEATMNVDALSYINMAIGDLAFDIRYKESDLSGSVFIRRPLTETDVASEILARVDIETLPIDLAFAEREERMIEGRPVKITANADELPIAIAGPFTPGLILQQGLANLDFTISGNYPDLSYSGEGKIRNGLLTVESTNVPYIVDANFSFQDRVLNIVGARVKNLPRDYLAGEATAAGKILFDGFTPENFDINIRAENKGLLVLSDATQAVNQNMYGDLVVATDRTPLKFTGSLDEPRLSGDVRVLNASLTLPYQESSSAASSSNVEFIDFSDWKERSLRKSGPVLPDSLLSASGIPTVRELQKKEGGEGDGNDLASNLDVGRKENPSPSVPAAEVSILDRMEIDLNIWLEERVFVKVQLGILQELGLNLANRNDEIPLEFYMKGDNMSLIGDVELAEGSRFVYLKTFDATGTVSFEQSVENPAFNIRGTYNGRRFNGNSERAEEYTVTVLMTGTRDKLDIRFDYSIAGVASTDDPEKRQTDAIMLLLLGRRFSESASGSALESLVDESVTGVGNSALNAALSDVLANIDVVQSFEVDLGQATDLGQARVDLVGQLGEFLVRYNGKISSFEDGTVSIEFPLLSFLNLGLQREVLDQFESLGGGGVISGSQGDAYRLRIRARHTW